MAPEPEPRSPLAVVIGGGGMGMSVARRLGQSHRIVLADVSEDTLRIRLGQLHEDGIDAVAVPVDITDAASVGALGEQVAAHGPVRALAHVAALAPTGNTWRRVMEVNLVGAALIERALLPLVAPGGAAVFVASTAGHAALPLAPEVGEVLGDPLATGFLPRLEKVWAEQDATAAYRLSKYGLIRLVRRRAPEWGARRARIVSLSPGLIDTPMGSRESAGDNEAFIENLVSKIPLHRRGTMVETADAVEFLASDRASYISGTDLLIDGGLTAVTRPD